MAQKREINNYNFVAQAYFLRNNFKEVIWLLQPLSNVRSTLNSVCRAAMEAKK